MKDAILDLAERREPWVDSPLFEALLERRPLAPETESIVRRYREDGYVVVEDLFDPQTVDRAALDTRRYFEEEVGAEGRRVSAESDEVRVQSAWRSHPAIRSLATADAILDLLRVLYRREPIPFQTLNFYAGSQQSPHADSIHFSCLPQGFMCGVWIALEDMDESNGPLVYYPGSHRLPAVDMFDLRRFVDGNFDPNYQRYECFARAVLAEAGLEPRVLQVSKGAALVWSANLMHGGEAILDRERTRLSQVTHYYFENCVYYTPMFSHCDLGELVLREIVDIRTDRPVPPRFEGEALGTEPLGGGRARMRRPAAGVRP